ERYVHASAIGRDLALLDGHVEPRDLAHPQIAQGLPRGLYRVLDRILPGHLARSHQVRHPIDAVACHRLSPCGGWSISMARVCGEDSRGLPAGQAAAPRQRWTGSGSVRRDGAWSCSGCSGTAGSARVEVGSDHQSPLKVFSRFFCARTEYSKTSTLALTPTSRHIPTTASAIGLSFAM